MLDCAKSIQILFKCYLTTLSIGLLADKPFGMLGEHEITNIYIVSHED